MITLYSVKWCQECIELKEYLEEKGVEFEVIDVADRQQDRDEVVRISGQATVPTLNIDGKVIVGFNRPQIDEALGLK